MNLRQAKSWSKIYLSIDPYHRFGLYIRPSRAPSSSDQAGDHHSTYGSHACCGPANPKYAVGDLLYSWVRWERFTVVEEPNSVPAEVKQYWILSHLGPLGAPA